jgi:hypothetical protein
VRVELCDVNLSICCVNFRRDDALLWWEQEQVVLNYDAKQDWIAQQMAAFGASDRCWQCKNSDSHPDFSCPQCQEQFLQCGPGFCSDGCVAAHVATHRSKPAAPSTARRPIPVGPVSSTHAADATIPVRPARAAVRRNAKENQAVFSTPRRRGRSASLSEAGGFEHKVRSALRPVTQNSTRGGAQQPAADGGPVPMSDSSAGAATPPRKSSADSEPPQPAVDTPATPQLAKKRTRSEQDVQPAVQDRAKRRRVLGSLDPVASPGKKRCCFGGPGADRRCNGAKNQQQQNWRSRPSVAVAACPFVNNSPECCLPCLTHRYSPALKQQQQQPGAGTDSPASNSPNMVSNRIGGPRRPGIVQGRVLDNVVDIFSFCDANSLDRLGKCSKRFARCVVRELQLRNEDLTDQLQRERHRTRQLRNSRAAARASEAVAIKQLRDAGQLLADLENVNCKVANIARPLLEAFRRSLINQRFDGLTMSFKNPNGMAKPEVRTLLALLWGKFGVPMHKCAAVAVACLKAFGFNVVDVPSSGNSVLRFAMELDFVAQYQTAKALAGRMDLNLGTDTTSTWWKSEHGTYEIRCPEDGDIAQHFIAMPQFVGGKDAKTMADRVESVLASVRERQQELGIPAEQQIGLPSIATLSVDNELANTGDKKGLIALLRTRRLAEHKRNVTAFLDRVREASAGGNVLAAADMLAPILADKSLFPDGVPEEKDLPRLLKRVEAAKLEALPELELDGCHLHVAGLIDREFSRNLDAYERKHRPELSNPTWIKKESFTHFVPRMVYKLLKFSKAIDPLLHAAGHDGRRYRVADARWLTKARYGKQLAEIWDRLMEIQREHGAALLPRCDLDMRVCPDWHECVVVQRAPGPEAAQ